MSLDRALVDLQGRAQVAIQGSAVFNTECIFSFDTPESPDGLYVCMEKFIGLGQRFVERYHKRTDCRLFLHIKRTRVPKKKTEGENGNGTEAKVSRLAIGIEGGFNPDEKKYDILETCRVVLLPEWKEYALDNTAAVPPRIVTSAKSILAAESAVKAEVLSQAAGTWDGEKIEVSKYAADLKQLDNGVKVAPRGWKCARCDLTTNLWLNLTDGTILCGRKFFDGSGGNNHAVEHFQETRYPLAVKLGTITANASKADVFSYAEDCMVIDPELPAHLAHFGINTTLLEKTDKSMTEIEIEMNQRVGEWATLCESGSKLVPVYGPGYTGMTNLGNTCYMNSVMQVLFTLKPFLKEYVDGAPAAFAKANLHDPLSDFRLLMCKLGTGLMSGLYSKPPANENDNLEERSIRPDMFKLCVGKGHPEFSGKGQQDAQEFYLHLCTLLEREKRRPGESNPAESLQFDVEDRVECSTSRKVRYISRREDYLPLPIAMEAAINKEEVDAFNVRKKQVEASGQKMNDEDKVRPIIPFQACLDRFCMEEEVSDFYSSAIKGKTVAKKKMRLKTFPPYLLIQLKKFDIGADWLPYKLDVEVQMPDEMDLSQATALGMQPGEEELPVEDEPKASTEPALIPDPSIVEQLSQMGFDINGCKRAAYHTKNTGIEAAMNWVLEHNMDADFGAPFEQPNSGGSNATAFEADPIALASLLSMGIPEMKSIKALKETSNNLERAVDWVFSHPDDDGTMDEAPKEKAGASGTSQSSSNTGPPKYQLSAFISHMGQSTLVGHYVAHIKREGRWVIYNDEKVAYSEKPPKGLGYLYLYKRIDVE